MTPDNSLSDMSAAHRAPRCRHIKVNGVRCAAPALRGRRLCYFHQRLLRPRRDYTLPAIEDATSLQLGLMQVIRALQDKAHDPKTCSLLLYALQIAGSNLRLMKEELPKPDDDDNDSLAMVLVKRLGLWPNAVPADAGSPSGPPEEPPLA